MFKNSNTINNKCYNVEDYDAKGFYGEGFLKFYTYEDDIFFFDNSTNTFTTSTDAETFFETAIGVGIGWEWVSDSEFLIDINGGIGRNLGFSDDANLGDITGRFGVNFG